jgi:hypothetical protein
MATILITILPLVGVLLGWSLTQITNYFNFYLADRRTLKETLYFLLEMRHQISAIKSIEDGIESYMRQLKAAVPSISSNEVEYLKAHSILRKIITDFNYPRIELELQEMTDNYDKCLLKLSTVDPIIAYKLKGKNKIVTYLNQWNNYATNHT